MTETTGTARRVRIHDATLRDGHHAVGHRFTAKQLRAYAASADRAAVDAVEVGHGNGLGASSLQIGQAALSDTEMLTAVREELSSTRMGVFAAPGWATADDLRIAIRLGADVLRIAAHCTEANVTQRHLGLLAEHQVEAQAVLLMSHMASPAQLAEQCALLVGYGAGAVGIMDSAGHFLPGDVKARIAAITDAAGTVPVIFHGHNNLGMAVANSIAAVEAGAQIIDACARGLGAGAGNTQIEVLVAVLERMGHSTGVDLRELMRATDLAEEHLIERVPTIDSIGLASGLSGVFSGFRLPVLKACAQAGVDPVDVLAELGARQAVAGQEDLIPLVIRHLQEA